MASSKKNKLPISRVRTIMKSSPDVENISAESVHLVARAAELFIKYLAKESHSRNQDKSQLQYKDIATVVNQDQELEFLRELIPMKITFKEYKEIMKNKKEHWVLPPLPKESSDGGECSRYSGQGDQGEEEEGEETEETEETEEAEEAAAETEEAEQVEEVEQTEEAEEAEAEQEKEVEQTEEAEEVEAEDVEEGEEVEEFDEFEESEQGEPSGEPFP